MAKPKVPSSLVVPPRMGMWWYDPSVQAVSGKTGTIVPSTTGRPFAPGLALGVPCSCSTRAADKSRRHWELEQPAASAKAVPWLKAALLCQEEVIGYGRALGDCSVEEPLGCRR